MLDEINLQDLFAYFKHQILYFILIIIVVLALGSLYSLIFQKPQYTSSTTLILTGINDGKSDGITTSDITLNSKLVTTYQEIIKSRKVLNQVVNNLKLDTEIEKVSKMISIKNITGTEIIKISVTDYDNKLAKDIADELAKVFSKEVKDIYNVSNISTLDYAELSTKPSNASYFKQLILYFVVGFVLAFVLLFVVYYFDTSIKSAEQVESKFGMTILGSVPDYNSVSKNKKSKRGGRR